MSPHALPLLVGALGLASCAQPKPSFVPLGGVESVASKPIAEAPPEHAPPSNPADNICHGEPSTEFRAVLLERSPAFEECYSTLLRKDPLAGGTVTALLRIGLHGDVERVWLDEQTLPDREFKECLVRGFSVPFSGAKPVGGCIIAEIPLSFSATIVVNDPT